MFAGLFAEIALVVSRMPVGYVNASVAIGILGFTLLPAGGVIEWFLPWEGRYTRLTRGLALFGTGVAILATIYWVASCDLPSLLSRFSLASERIKKTES